jgi:hypothetical protein
MTAAPADDGAVERLARTRDGPRGRRSPGAISNRASNPPRPKTSAGVIVSRDGDSGRAPREVTP